LSAGRRVRSVRIVDFPRTRSLTLSHAVALLILDITGADLVFKSVESCL
jgi:hypothetical protein